MDTRKSIHARALALMLLLLCLAAFPAEIPQQEPHSDQASERLTELGEVLVSGAKPSRKASEILTWMRRLIGQFSYEGHVDLGGQGSLKDQQPVHGVGNCVGFGVAPAVRCEIRVSWPEVRARSGEDVHGGASNLNPAIILYGFEPDELGIRYMLVDSNGVAAPALGLVVGDTLVSRGSCVDQSGNCQRVIPRD